jgi:uncharacterized protein (TIGR03435 family)
MGAAGRYLMRGEQRGAGTFRLCDLVRRRIAASTKELMPRALNLLAKIPVLIVLTIAGATASQAQDSAAPPQSVSALPAPNLEFDVVSIKLNRSGDKRMSHAMPANGGGLTLTNVPLFVIVLYAYSFNRPSLTFGLPDWTKTTRFDIAAKVTGSDLVQYQKLSNAERRRMLQKVLEDRFQLKTHWESRPMLVYEFVVAKSGVKMKEAGPGETSPNGQSIVSSGPNQLTARVALVENLALALSDLGMDRPVIDRTGLTAKYDFTLHYAPIQDAGTASAEATEPSIFTAVEEQLGLKLKPANAPVQSLVVDRIEEPSEN